MKIPSATPASRAALAGALESAFSLECSSLPAWCTSFARAAEDPVETKECYR
ncbi:hypothetical protein BCR35DRAFT_298946 [Leucosporidium creatinivorum]|uniref:Uncharacterized protein n=1 Tax=Leucosporidium creatinivorum TaxID=106004 RepID=A0A1Y2G6Q6_9BASI|nr:hypothetical protein BCR35DRAFT_298946 [Leucosporidium creatinivorum]